ncbi:MAG: hypothetical protein KGJ49_12115 [Alphaproteobacteria bacterium]|nr:hypothetical protein [Alphaproteobacteria bacterium]
MRRLIHVPIVHSQTDLGPLQDRVRQAYIEKGGEQAWKASREAVAEFWNAIEQAMDRIALDCARLRLYQDGLPVCGQEMKIVHDLAQQGGANYRILLKLTGRGAKIEGTEDPDLLRKEYELMMTGLSAGAGTGATAQTDKAESAAVFRDLLDRRDRFIARRIDKTLQAGETGTLFLGALHHATQMLPDTIQTTSLNEFLRDANEIRPSPKT